MNNPSSIRSLLLVMLILLSAAAPCHMCTYSLSPAGNFTASLNLYRANFSAQVMGNTTPVLPPYKLSMPVLAVHPEKDSYCLEAQIASSKDVVAEGCWQYKSVPGGHWFFVQEPDVLNKLLLDFLGGVQSTSG